MLIKRGYSTNPIEHMALAEIYSQIFQEDIGVIILFCSSNYDINKLSVQIKQLMGHHLVFACTTAGEICSSGYINNSITGVSISTKKAKFHFIGIPDISNFNLNRAEKIATDFKSNNSNFLINSSKFVGLLLIDGLSKAEDKFIYSISKSFYPMEIIGGSSGDDLKLENTYVFNQEKFVTNYAALLIIETEIPYFTFKIHNFIPTEKRLVVTESDYDKRIVYELNAEKAAIEYAAALGLEVSQLTTDVFAKYPLMVKVGNEWYVRALVKANPDGSLSFLCSVSEGTVLTIANSKDIVENLKFEFNNLNSLLGNISLIISFDCILRRIELNSKNLIDKANEILCNEAVVGFSTYGEQCNSVHVNHTMTGIAFGL